MSFLLTVAIRGARFLLVIALVVFGSTVLVRYAPGYLSDAREMDARYSARAEADLANEATRSASVWHMFGSEIGHALKGDFGRSRQFDLPVRSLVAARIPATVKLMAPSILCAWLLSLAFALCTTLQPGQGVFWSLPAAVLLALPASVLATVSLLSEVGGPVLVLTLILTARDFTLTERLLRKLLKDGHVLQARAQGIGWRRLLIMYVGPGALPQMAAIAGLSFVTVLGAIIPVEVLFGVPGIGQLAWNAAMNRDLPVLLAVTALMAVVMASLGGFLGGILQAKQEVA